jgi:hypothetical protein
MFSFILLTAFRINSPQRYFSENLGKTFEKAICLLYDTKYYGNTTQYDLLKAQDLMQRTNKLKQIYPTIKHNHKYTSKYDFIIKDSYDRFLSAKTTKTRGKVCPQVIGQCTKKTFCDYFNIINTDIANVKIYIQNNIPLLLKNYFDNTFLCPILYYNEKLDKLAIIKRKEEIIWNQYNLEFRHIQYNKQWLGSTTLYIIDEITNKNIPLGEFQIHNQRDTIKFRWYFENLLNFFSDKFEIEYL